MPWGCVAVITGKFQLKSLSAYEIKLKIELPGVAADHRVATQRAVEGRGMHHLGYAWYFIASLPAACPVM